MSLTPRTPDSENRWPETSDRSRRSEAGDTLVEVLLALVVLGLASVALIIAFSTSISASSLHRRLASADIVLNSSSQQAIAGIGSQLTLFTSCVTLTTTTTTINTFIASAGISVAANYSSQFSATITNVQYWNASTSGFDTTCRTDVPEEITVTVTDAKGHQYINQFVVDYPLASATSSTNVGPGTKLVWTTEPSSSASSGAAFSTQPVLEVQNALGQPVTTDYSPVIISIVSGSNGALSSCSGNENSGYVAFTGCSISLTGGATSGTYTLQAVDGSLTSPVSTSISLSGATQPYLVFTRQPAAGKSGSGFSTQPVLKVEQNGSPIIWSGSITLTSSGGVLAGCSGLSTTTGVFNVAGCTFQGGYIYDPVSQTYAAIPYTLYASGSGLTSATSSAFTVTGAGTASQLVFTTQPSGISAGSATTAFSTQPVVTVEDAFGNIVTNYNTSVSMAISAGQTKHGCNSVTPNNGVATFSNCAGSAYATGVTLTASSTSLPNVKSASFNITGLATKLMFTTQPVAGVSGATFGFQPVVTIYDSNGYVVTASTTAITLTSSGGALALCTGLTPVNGVVTVSTCTFAGIVGTNYTLTAKQGLLSVTSATFSPTGPGSATQLAFTTQPVAGASQSPFTTQPVIKVEDSAGNIVISDNETITLTASGGVLSGCSNLSAVTGVVDVANCVFQGVVGTNYQLTASTVTGNLASATSANFWPSSAGPASQVVLTGCSAAITWPNTCLATAVAEDIEGNTETSYNSAITFSQVSSTGGTVSGLGPVTAVAGNASDTLTTTNVGTLTIAATGDGFTSNPVTITIVGALQTVAFYTNAGYATTTTSGSTTYNPSVTYQVFAKGSQNGTITFTSTTTSVCTINAATGVVTTVAAGTCNLTAAAGAIGNYAASSTTPFTLTINQAPALTVTAQSQTLTYSGGSAPTDTSAVTGFVNGDTATVTGATYTYASTSGPAYGPSTTRPTHAGTYSVTPSGGTLNITGNGVSSDYTSPNIYVAGTLTINPAPALKVVAVSQTLMFTGSQAVGDTSSVVGLVGSDAASTTGVLYHYDSTGSTPAWSSSTPPSAVGSYTVTPRGGTLSVTAPALSADYNAPNTYGTGTLTITKPVLTITAANQNVTYSGGSAPTDTSTVTGFVNGDTATLTGVTYTYASTSGPAYGPSTTRPTHAGTYSVTPSGATLSFTPSSSSSTYVSPYTYVAGTLTINPAPALTVTAQPQTLNYTGNPAVADTTNVTGALPGDAATVTGATYTYASTSGPAYGPSTTRPTHAGTYSVTPSGGTLNITGNGVSSDYTSPNIYVAGTLTINPAPALKVVAVSQTLMFTNSQAVADASKVVGLVGTDAASATGVSYFYTGSGYSSATPPSAVGSYTVTPSLGTLSVTAPALSTDYNSPNTYGTGTLTIISETELTHATWSGSSSSVSTPSFTAVANAPVLVLVSYDHNGGARTCNPTLTVTGGVLNTSSLVPGSATTWNTNKGPTSYMCVYRALGGGTGVVTVGFSGGSGSIDNASIQVVQFQGDNAAQFGLVQTLNNDSSSKSSSPSFTLSSTPTSPNPEVLFGDSLGTTWTTVPSGFTSLTADSTSAFTPAVYIGGPAATAITGTLQSPDYWGTMGIEVTP